MADLTLIEKRAKLATELSAFPVNLSAIREKLKQILGEWKGVGMFREYTDHTFQHVTDMLETAEWIIPAKTKETMTDGDYFMLTLSIYFHDLGLLVTKDEYDNRSKNPDFAAFLGKQFLDADKQENFKARLDLLGKEEADKLLYQEFVRATHGERIRTWIEGTGIDDGNATTLQRDAVRELLQELDITIRRDLAKICESHTRGHSESIAELKVSQPYGDDNATVNLRYLAVILRTVDILQITNKRAPAVLYQLINPNNPVSQREWLKQSAVRSVRAKPPRDRDGKVTDEGMSGEVEVHATFEEPDGFFALTSFLTYARTELEESYKLVERSSQEVARPYIFPWRDIDDAGVETSGFLSKSFKFEMDERRILDLLTGHTLYNDTDVVVRELVQNALDAVRLQESTNSTEQFSGRVDIKWDSKARELVVLDNGTGMTQEVIQNHLLKVGSSKYQDSNFKKENPDFYSISRFGIGVLSTFMVSDEVEITTCSLDDEQARQIALQSVHGKYLIKLLDKVVERDQINPYPHGTEVRVKLRPTANLEDVLKLAKTWFVFPRCEVFVHIDNEDPIKVGYESPRQAMLELAQQFQSKNKFSRTEYKVESVVDGGLEIAFLLEKSHYFPEWRLVCHSEGSQSKDDGFKRLTGSCVEGVLVEMNSPGCAAVHICALSNSVGANAPRTNVARTALEDTEELTELNSLVYKAYTDHVSSEIIRISELQNYSITKAATYAPYLMTPFNPHRRFRSSENLLASVRDIPHIVLEENGERSIVSANKLHEQVDFETMESVLLNSIEFLVSEAPANTSVMKLMDMLGQKVKLYSKSKILVCNSRYTNILDTIERNFSTSKVVADTESKSLSLIWTNKTSDSPKWQNLLPIFHNLMNEAPRVGEAFREHLSKTNTNATEIINWRFPLGDPEVANLDDYGSFKAHRKNYIVPASPLSDFISDRITKADEPDKIYEFLMEFCGIVYLYQFALQGWDLTQDSMDGRIRRSIDGGIMDYALSADLRAIVAQQAPRMFDPYAWKRSESELRL